MITLMAIIKAKKGSEADLEAGLSALVKKVEAEEGTLEYILNKSLTDPCTFMVFEVYKDNDALAYHGSTDYFKAAMKGTAEFVDGKPQIEMYSEVTRIKK
jgi:quinol monooxygenase YgiN